MFCLKTGEIFHLQNLNLIKSVRSIEVFTHVYWTWIFDVHYVDIMLNLHHVLMGLWFCALFCPLWMWGFDPAIYISFFFSLYNAAFSACLNTYSMRYILACWISWSWKCCMECYNKVIFFYKLQLKWFVFFFMGIWWFDDPSLCDHQCTVFAIYVGHFVLTLPLLAHGAIMHMLFSWNLPKELVFM